MRRIASSALRSVEFKYRRVGPELRCSYCGDTGDTIDHAVPRSHVREHIRAYRRNWFPKVAACAECNSLLGDQVDATFHERKRRVADCLRARYAKVLLAGGWDETELVELGYSLRHSIEAAMYAGRRAASRIAFASIGATADVPDDLFGLFTSQDDAE